MDIHKSFNIFNYSIKTKFIHHKKGYNDNLKKSNIEINNINKKFFLFYKSLFLVIYLKIVLLY